MKKLLIFLLVPLLFLFASCSSNTISSIPSTTDTEAPSQTEKTNTSTNDEVDAKYMYATINNQVLEIKLENNSSANAMLEKLKDGDVVVAMHDYGNFEKVGSLGFTLPRNDISITTTPGDVILYQENQITIYYDENTWNLTKLGHIDITQSGLKSILGNGDVEVVFSLENKR